MPDRPPLQLFRPFLALALGSTAASMILSGVRGPTPRALSWLFLAVTLVLFGCGLYLAPRALRQSGPLRRRNAILTLVIYAIGTCIGVVGALVLLLGESR